VNDAALIGKKLIHMLSMGLGQRLTIPDSNRHGRQLIGVKWKKKGGQNTYSAARWDHIVVRASLIRHINNAKPKTISPDASALRPPTSDLRSPTSLL
jgi:hypothetical protein